MSERTIVLVGFAGLVIAAAVMLWAPWRSPAEPAVDPNRPVWLALEAISHDFGTHDLPGQSEKVLEHTFRFRNTGSAPQRVVSTTSSCGCTTAEATPTEIAPDGELAVAVTMTLAHAARRSSTVWVRFADGRGVTCTVVGIGRRPRSLAIQPNELALADERSIELTVRVTQHPDFPDPEQLTLSPLDGLEWSLDDWTRGDAVPGEIQHFSTTLRVRRTGDTPWPLGLTVELENADRVTVQLRLPE